MPRFIVFVRANPDSEGGGLPEPGMFEAMSAYNATMIEAGILLAGEGLLASSRDSRRLVFHDSTEPTLESGPFPTNELVSGYWILKVKDVEEAVSWVKKCPAMEEGNVLEVRRIAEAEDFGDALSPELQQKEAEMRKQSEKLAEGK
jgi:hypothetical protein